MSDTLIPFGLLGDRMVAVAEVSRGLACGCVCPECKTALVARKGVRRRGHFAHAASNPNCKYGAETAIHLMSKQCLLDAGCIALPAFVWQEVGEDEFGLKYEESEEVCASSRLTFDNALAEYDMGDLRPDIVGWSDGRTLLVEIRVRHAVAADKLELLRSRGLECVEVDLSNQDWAALDVDRVRQIVVESVNAKRWLSHPALNEVRSRLCERVRERVREANARRRNRSPTFVLSPPQLARLPAKSGQVDSSPQLEPTRRILICETCRELHDLGNYRDSLHLDSFACTRCGDPVGLSRTPLRRPAWWQ